MNILHIHASTRIKGSHSHELVRALLQHIERTDLPVHVDSLDLWSEELPAVDDRFMEIRGKVSEGITLTNAERVIWSPVERLIARIKSADVLVWSIPMWNFGVPYVVKHFIDLVTQYGYLFTINESGYQGLLDNKPTLLAFSSGGSYGPGSGAEAYNHQEPYMRTLLGFWGIEDIHVARWENTMVGEEKSATSLEGALHEVEQFAEGLTSRASLVTESN